MSNVSRAVQSLLVVAVFLFAGVASAAAEVDRIILDSGATVALYNPSVALDDNGTLHIAAQGRAPVTDDNSTVEIYYLSLTGSTVRAATRVNVADASNEGRAKIAVTAAGKVVVAWAGTNQAMKAVLLDPAAAPASLIEIAETTVGASTGGGHFNMAIDGAGKVHIIRALSGGLLHTRFDPATLVPDVAEHAIGTAASSNRQIDPGVGIDENDRLHVAYSADDIDGQGPAAYMMLNNDGTVRIAPTVLFDRAGVYAHATHFSLIVDSSSRVHVIFGDKRNTISFDQWSDYGTSGTAFYTRLDPSADDQSGDAADVDAIRVGDEEEIGNFWYGQAYKYGSTIHFLAGIGNHGNGDIIHVGISGGRAGSSRIIHAQNGGYGIAKKYVRGAGKHVVWAEEIYAPTLTGITTQLVRASTSAMAGGGGGGGSLPLGTLALLAGVGLFRLRSRRLA